MYIYICCFADKLYRETGGDVSRDPSGLVLIALAHALSLFSAVSASINISGGHVNPAVTFGALLGGRISVLRAFYYWLAQLLGAIVACLLLRLVTAGMVIMLRYYYVLFYQIFKNTRI